MNKTTSREMNAIMNGSVNIGSSQFLWCLKYWRKCSAPGNPWNISKGSVKDATAIKNTKYTISSLTDLVLFGTTAAKWAIKLTRKDEISGHGYGDGDGRSIEVVVRPQCVSESCQRQGRTNWTLPRLSARHSRSGELPTQHVQLR